MKLKLSFLAVLMFVFSVLGQQPYYGQFYGIDSNSTSLLALDDQRPTVTSNWNKGNQFNVGVATTFMSNNGAGTLVGLNLFLGQITNYPWTNYSNSIMNSKLTFTIDNSADVFSVTVGSLYALWHDPYVTSQNDQIQVYTDGINIAALPSTKYPYTNVIGGFTKQHINYGTNILVTITPVGSTILVYGGFSIKVGPIVDSPLRRWAHVYETNMWSISTNAVPVGVTTDAADSYFTSFLPNNNGAPAITNNAGELWRISQFITDPTNDQFFESSQWWIPDGIPNHLAYGYESWYGGNNYMDNKGVVNDMFLSRANEGNIIQTLRNNTNNFCNNVTRFVCPHFRLDGPRMTWSNSCNFIQGFTATHTNDVVTSAIWFWTANPVNY